MTQRNVTQLHPYARRLAACLWCLLVSTAFAAQAAERLSLNFDPDWKFIKADPEGAMRPDFNDEAWPVVSLPHTFNDTDTFDDWSVPGHIGETNQWSGRTWYRKAFTLPEAFRDKRIYLEFEAVRQIAEIYLNGQPLGTNRTGFIPFGFDLTTQLKFGGITNVLAVMADNRFTLEKELAAIAATDLPWNSPHWHPAHGGIYRNVFLHVTDPLHLSLPLYSSLGTAGPYIYAERISEKSAEIHCELPVQNQRRSAAVVVGRVEVFDAAGSLVLTLQDSQPVKAGASALLSLSGRLAGPQLWEPDYPYLYRVVCSLMTDGKPADDCAIPLGIRYARWDARSGFYLNGRHLKLHGWGQKPTNEWPGLGAAQPDWMHYFTLNLMKGAGGNFVRWGHCAGGPADIASADQLGLLVLQPGVDGEGDARDAAWKLRAASFRDTIVYYRNHPSILLWEGGNQKVSRDHAHELRAAMDTYDPHGGRAYTQRRADEITAEVMDVDLGTEGGRQVPRLPVLEGEYNREESPRRVWDDYSPPNFGYPEAKGLTYQLTSEQYALNQVTQYVEKLGARSHAGGANWIFSDSTSGGRVPCEVARTGGEVDGVRLPKEAYYACQAMFREDPQVHILGHWTYPPGTRKPVYVASNGDAIELFVNGRSRGQGQRSETYLFSFPDVPWEPGEIKAVARRHGNVIATQIKQSAGPPVGLRLTQITGPNGWQADGSDIALVDVEAVDDQGRCCPTIQRRVDFDWSGPGVWRGGYNSGKTNSINNSFLDLECGINRVALRSGRTPGPFTLTARCGELSPARLTINALPVAVENGWIPEHPPLPALGKLQKPAPDDREQVAAAELESPASRCLKTFSYSGPAASVRVRPDARDGARVYADRDFLFRGLPELLKGSDWVQAANTDKLYSAVDLMELGPGRESLIYVAHDTRLPRPDWLQRLFKPTDKTLAIAGGIMALFERQVSAGESLTLGANTDDRQLKNCNMYVVFVKPTAAEKRPGAGSSISRQPIVGKTPN